MNRSNFICNEPSCEVDGKMVRICKLCDDNDGNSDNLNNLVKIYNDFRKSCSKNT